MLIPIRTDAPIYHRPWATGGLAAATVLAQLWADTAGEAAAGSLLIRYGTLQPLQWITSVFLHADWIHLAGNLAFLWSFGLVIEGKVGARRFLAIYAAIAAASGLVEQLLMLGATGGSLGASGVIFGLIGIALVWAPENEIECIWFMGMLTRTVEFRIRTFAFMFAAFQVIGMIFSGLAPSSGLLHLLGMAAGLPIGILMLKRGLVDCEGWDWFALRERRVRLTRQRSAPRIRRA